jgi:hypothetical protein
MINNNDDNDDKSSVPASLIDLYDLGTGLLIALVLQGWKLYFNCGIMALVSKNAMLSQ